MSTAPLDLVTLNLRYANPEDGEWRWEFRRAGVLDWLNGLRPDLIAFQEVLPEQRRDLDQGLPDYRSYGIGRDGGGRGEQCAWYVREPWFLEDADTFWLSPTPRQPGAAWGARLSRICSAVRLRAGERRLWAGNVHLDHESAEARRRGLELAANARPPELPGLIVGDFNEADLLSQVPALSGWTDAQVEAGQAERGTFHDFRGGLSGPRIDAILYSPEWVLESFQLVENPALSDHYPLLARLLARGATPA